MKDAKYFATSQADLQKKLAQYAPKPIITINLTTSQTSLHEISPPCYEQLLEHYPKGNNVLFPDKRVYAREGS